MKMTSRIAIAALASVIAAPAFAADLGGNCCADLEERIAELEATTARKGNRKVTLEVSGHVNEFMVFWSGDQQNVGPGGLGALHPDDSGFLVATNNTSRSRFRFKGAAKINAEWEAGFLIEIGVRGTNSSQTNAFNANDLNEKPGLDVRHEALYIDSKRLGRIWLGHTSSAADGITEICVGCGIGQGPDTGPYLGGFRPFGGGGLSWQQIASSTGGSTFAGEGDRRDMVSYTSPALMGFTFSAAVGSDQFWDVALRYANEFNGVRVAAGVGYQSSEEQGGTIFAAPGAGSTATKGFAAGCITNLDNRVDCEAFGVSASVMHVASGIYVAGSYGLTRDNSFLAGLAFGDEDRSWYVTGGVNRKFHALGATNIYGEYGESERGIGVALGFPHEMRWWGVGISQTIDAAAMDIYLNYKHYEGDTFGGLVPVSDLDLVALGAIIRF